MANNTATKKKACFVVGPIGKEGSDVRTHSDWLYEGIIKPAFDGLAEFDKPIRADMIAQPGMITTQVIEHLLEDDLVIADLSLANPNAFYEIGIRHMVQKPIVHMQLKGEPEPFDTSGFRAIKFALRHPSDLVEAKRDLAAAVKTAIAEGHRVENPVTHARGMIELEARATPEERVIVDQFEAIGRRLSAIEANLRPVTTPVFIHQSETVWPQQIDVAFDLTKPGAYDARESLVRSLKARPGVISVLVRDGIVKVMVDKTKLMAEGQLDVMLREFVQLVGDDRVRWKD